MSAGSIAKQVLTGSGLIDTLSDLIIRPPRAVYTMDDLQKEIFTLSGKPNDVYWRHDLKLKNMRDLTIQCSWYKPMVVDEHGSHIPVPLPCVIYCHGNCGSRLDALEALNVLENGFTLFTFDFCGCGMSDGEYVSLGYYERQDLAAVVEYLKEQVEEVNGIAIWGRSMGAVTAIMYAAEDPDVNCIVCDSPFSSLKELINDLVAQCTKSVSCCIPNPFKRGAVQAIRKRIAKRASFDIDDIDTVKFAKDCKVPAMLIHGESDNFVFPEHSERVHGAFQASCMRRVVRGGHNDERSAMDHKVMINFMAQHCKEGRKQEDGEPCRDSDIEGFAGISGIEIEEDLLSGFLKIFEQRLNKAT